MNRTARQRRAWLSRALGVAAGSLLLRTAQAGTPDGAPGESVIAPHYLTTCRNGPDDFQLVLLDERGNLLHRQALPARAHGAATHAGRGTGCVFARRPGQWFCAVDLHRPGRLHTVAPPIDRRFSGHGVYSATGARLYTTESDIDRQRGVVGVYDVGTGYRRIDEFASEGIGPHEIVRVPGTDLLVVANGGIATHPDVDGGREPLNLDDMAPSIAVIDGRDGRPLSQHRLPDGQHRISLRHLAVDGARRVWYAGQYGRADDDRSALPAADTRALAGSFTLAADGTAAPGGALAPLLLPDGLLPGGHGYLSSVASAGDDVLYTAARDGVAFVVDPVARRVVDRQAYSDCSGVAADARGGYLVSSGTGDLAHLVRDGRWLDLEPLAMTPFAWDNHVGAVRGPDLY